MIIFLPGAALGQVDPAIHRFEFFTPRPFGYFIGDLIKHELRLEFGAPYQLQEQSLPQAGRLNHWLELRPLRVRMRQRRKSTVYEITLVYQLFNAATNIQTVVTPAHTLVFNHQDQTLSLAIPAWHFTVLPLTQQGKARALPDLQPDRPPPEISSGWYWYRLALVAGGLLAALFYLAYVHWTIPFIARSNGPFAQAYRHLKKLRDRSLEQAIYYDALRCLHCAFNQTAGRTLFLENLEGFFADYPQYLGSREAIHVFFAQSREIFFGSDKIKPQTLSLDWLLQLCHDCRRVERGLL